MKEEFEEYIERFGINKGVVGASLQFSDPMNGWGLVSTYAKKMHLVKTTNGGEDWEHIREIKIESERSIYHKFDEDLFKSLYIGFVDEMNGFIAHSTFLLYTDDGGRTFNRFSFPLNVGEIKQLLINQGHAYLVTDKHIMKY
jgi:photosystem II stability/assembly factor-like uncharacterized protein